MRRARRRFPVLITALLMWVGTAPVVFAASGDAVSYTITVTKVEISKNGGTSYTTLFTGSQAIDIAAANAGAVAASLVSGVSCATGTYDTVRVTIGANLLLKGYVNNGGTTLYTDGTSFTLNALASNTPGVDYGTSTFSISSTSITTTGLAILVQSGASPVVSVSFDTSGVITQSGGVPSVSAPSVSITAS